MPDQRLNRNIGLDLMRATEAAALAAARWMGLGLRQEAETSARTALARALDNLEVDGVIVVGEEQRFGALNVLPTGLRVGTGRGF